MKGYITLYTTHNHAIKQIMTVAKRNSDGGFS